MTLNAASSYVEFTHRGMKRIWQSHISSRTRITCTIIIGIDPRSPVNRGFPLVNPNNQPASNSKTIKLFAYYEREFGRVHLHRVKAQSVNLMIEFVIVPKTIFAGNWSQRQGGAAPFEPDPCSWGVCGAPNVWPHAVITPFLWWVQAILSTL
jgi:hypothetical protein